MLKIYCCHRKDFQEQGLAVIELVYMNIEWEEVLVLIDHEGLMFGL